MTVVFMEKSRIRWKQCVTESKTNVDAAVSLRFLNSEDIEKLVTCLQLDVYMC